MIGTAPMTTHIKKNRRRKRPFEEGFMEVPFDWRAEKGRNRPTVSGPTWQPQFTRWAIIAR
jgi:hypothetical protein